MFRIVICDDSRIYIDEFKEMFMEIADKTEEICFFEFDSGEKLLSDFPEDVDLTVLDMDLLTMNGNDVGKILRERGYTGLIVLCSGRFAPNPENFVISAYRYMIKQDGRENNIKIVESVWKKLRLQKEKGFLRVTYNGQIMLVNRHDIRYIARHRLGSQIYVSEKKDAEYGKMPLICRMNLEELFVRMKASGFAMPHNSYIINLEHVTGVNKNEVKLSGDITLTIAASKKKQFYEEVLSYMDGKYD